MLAKRCSIVRFHSHKNKQKLWVIGRTEGRGYTMQDVPSVSMQNMDWFLACLLSLLPQIIHPHPFHVHAKGVVMVLLQHFIQADRVGGIQIRKHQPRIAQMIPYRILVAQGYGAAAGGHIGIVHAAICKVDRLQLAGAAHCIVFDTAQVVPGVLLGGTYGYFFAQFHACGVVAQLYFVAIRPADNAG
jgi:hypothetical protein